MAFLRSGKDKYVSLRKLSEILRFKVRAVLNIFFGDENSKGKLKTKNKGWKIAKLFPNS